LNETTKAWEQNLRKDTAESNPRGVLADAQAGSELPGIIADRDKKHTPLICQKYAEAKEEDENPSETIRKEGFGQK